MIWKISKTEQGEYSFEEHWSPPQPDSQEFLDDKFLAFHPSEHLVAHANQWGDDVRILDLSKDPPVSVMLGDDKKTRDMYLGWHGLAFTPENRLVVVGEKLGLDSWPISSGGKKKSLTPANLFADSQIAVSKKGLLAGVTDTQAISIVDSKTGEVIYTLPAEASAVYSLAWNPSSDKSQLVVGKSDGGISVWDVSAVQKALEDVGLK